MLERRSPLLIGIIPSVGNRSFRGQDSRAVPFLTSVL
jgi:hypothetical protein